MNKKTILIAEDDALLRRALVFNHIYEALVVTSEDDTILDWNAGAKDTVALKYYYQHDPTIAPYAYSNVPGFSQHLDAGSQVFSINNVNMLRPNLSVTETLGAIREKLGKRFSSPEAFLADLKS